MGDFQLRRSPPGYPEGTISLRLGLGPEVDDLRFVVRAIIKGGNWEADGIVNLGGPFTLIYFVLASVISLPK